MNLRDFRAQYPQYEKVPDQQLAEGLYKRYYADKVDRSAFYRELGVAPEGETVLPPDQEADYFLRWKQQHAPNDSGQDYDLRGAYQAEQAGDLPERDARGHGPDTFKKPNHPTFSDQSKYNGVNGQQGGHWATDDQGNTTFTPGPANLKHHTAEELQRYFVEREPGVQLLMPDQAPPEQEFTLSRAVGNAVKRTADPLDPTLTKAREYARRGFAGEVGDALVSGATKTDLYLRAAGWLTAGATEDADQLAMEIAKATEAAPPRAAASEQFDAALKDAGWRWREADGVRDKMAAAGEALGAVVTNPRAVTLSVAEQISNFVPGLVGGASGAAVGALGGAAAGGPAGAAMGATIYGAAGMAGGEIAVETGAKVLELLSEAGVDLRDPTQVASALKSPGFRQAAQKAGLIKGSVIAAIDVATMKAGGALLSAPARELEQKVSTYLLEMGVDITDKAAVDAALAAPAAKQALAGAFEQYLGRTTMGSTSARAAGAMGIETAGEGLGEGLGETAAGGQTSFEDVTQEMIGSLGQSAMQTGVEATTGAITGLTSSARRAAKGAAEPVGSEPYTGTEAPATPTSGATEPSVALNPDDGEIVSEQVWMNPEDRAGAAPEAPAEAAPEPPAEPAEDAPTPETEAVAARAEAVSTPLDEKEQAKADKAMARAAKMAERNAKESKIDTDVDDVLAAIAKAGGISREQAERAGIDPAEFKRKGWRIKPVFTKNGATLEAMSERLSQLGYPVTDENGQYGENAMLDAIDRALRGERLHTQATTQRLAEQERVAQEAAPESEYDPIEEFDAPPAGAAAPVTAPDWMDDDYEPILEDDEYESLSHVGQQRLLDAQEAARDAGVAEDDIDAIIERGAIRGLSYDDIIAEIQARHPAQDQGADERGGAGSAAPDQEEQGRGQDPEAALGSYSAEDLADRERQKADAASARAAADQKAAADAERDTFTLTGSDREADQAAAAGQTGLFDAPAPRVERKPEPAKAKGKTELVDYTAARDHFIREIGGDPDKQTTDGDVDLTDEQWFEVENRLAAANRATPIERAREGGLYEIPSSTKEAEPRKAELQELDGVRVGDRVTYTSADGSITYDGTVRSVADRSGNKRASVEADEGKLYNTSIKRLTKQQADSAPNVDEAAHEAATSPTNDLPEPTDAQKEAGNYKKGHLKLDGLDISIENPAGSKRRPEWPTLKSHYGYVKRTEGADGDHIDVFVKPGTNETWSGSVFVVNQVHPDTGKFDEHKVMIGWHSERDARAAYLENYTKDWKGLGEMLRVDYDEFLDWLYNTGDTTKPFADPKADPANHVTVHGARYALIKNYGWEIHALDPWHSPATSTGYRSFAGFQGKKPTMDDLEKVAAEQLKELKSRAQDRGKGYSASGEMALESMWLAPPDLKRPLLQAAVRHMEKKTDKLSKQVTQRMKALLAKPTPANVIALMEASNEIKGNGPAPSVTRNQAELASQKIAEILAGAPAAKEESVTTPRTRLKWKTLTEWNEAFSELERRHNDHISRKSYEDIDAHWVALHDNSDLVDASTDEAALQLLHERAKKLARNVNKSKKELAARLIDLAHNRLRQLQQERGTWVDPNKAKREEKAGAAPRAMDYEGRPVDGNRQQARDQVIDKPTQTIETTEPDLATQAEQPAPATPAETPVDYAALMTQVSPALLRRIRVQVDQMVESEGVKRVEVSAADALKDIRRETAAFQKLLKCVGG